nr:hypothetical protein [Neisseria iguanae]
MRNIWNATPPITICTKSVWYEFFESMPQAIAKEKAMKKWRREWKIRLIEEDNPD